MIQQIPSSVLDYSWFLVLSNPDFLVKCPAIADLEDPVQVLIGVQYPEAIEALAEIHRHSVQSDRILRTNLWSSELGKLTASVFLAQLISSINDIAVFCEATGADVCKVVKAISAGSRNGPKFLQAGPGFGGICLQKDILNPVYLCCHYGLEEVAAYWEQVVTLNTCQRRHIARLVIIKLYGTVSGKPIAVLGIALKSDTNDTRDSPALCIRSDLLQEGAILMILDPKVSERQISLIISHAAAEGQRDWRVSSNGYGSCRHRHGYPTTTHLKGALHPGQLAIGCGVAGPPSVRTFRCRIRGPGYRLGVIKVLSIRSRMCYVDPCT